MIRLKKRVGELVMVPGLKNGITISYESNGIFSIDVILCVLTNYDVNYNSQL